MASTSSSSGPTGASGLSGKRIAVSRPDAETRALAGLLEPLGAQVTAVPLIAIEPPADPVPLLAAVAALERYDWVVVTSAHAAAAIARVRGVLPWPPRVRVAAIGDGTARFLSERGIQVALVPAKADGAGFAAALAREQALAGARVLFPRSSLARGTVPAALRAAGAEVDEVEAYRTRLDPAAAGGLAQALARREVDALVLTSPSNADSLAAVVHDFGTATHRVRLVAIGATTAERLRELGRPADAVADRPDPAALLAALAAVFAPAAAAPARAAENR